MNLPAPTTPAPFRARLGIDGARAGWVVASHGGSGPSLDLIPDFSGLVERVVEVGALVDIPIGLPGPRHPTRECDAAARRRLPGRASSVFPTLSRAALSADGWAEANEVNRRVVGRGLPRQSWGLAVKIRQVDELMSKEPSLRGRLRESHPELAFAWLNDGRPLDRPKRDRRGLADRVALLEARWADVGEVTRDFAGSHTGVGVDDALDALALLALGEAGSVPLPISVPTDGAGLPMEILVHPSLAPAPAR